MARLEDLNHWPEERFTAELTKCCGSKAWVHTLFRARPFSSPEDLMKKASTIWKALTPEDWKEAFSHHPRIGSQKTSGWSSQEQAGVTNAEESVKAQLQSGNEEYFNKFGFVFLICATGKSASEMLQALNRRLKRSLDEEIEQAALEHDQITQIRLGKLLNG